VFEWTAAAGFEGVEISPHWLDLVGASDVELASVRREAAAAGLAISGINVNRCLFTRGEQAANHRRMLTRTVHASAILAAPLVTLSLSLPLGGSPRPTLRGCDVSEQECQQVADGIAELAELAGRNHIDLSLELHDDGLLDTPELCLEMLRRLSATNIGVNPDLGNLIRGQPQADWRAALRLLAPHTNNWHVKNYRAQQPSPVWDGDIDYAAALHIMRTAGYDGPASIESYFGDVLELQTRSLTYFKQLEQIATKVP
jgi:sugar phosphate isomerase/epimerase